MNTTTRVPSLPERSGSTALTPERRDALIRRGRELRSAAAAELFSALWSGLARTVRQSGREQDSRDAAPHRSTGQLAGDDLLNRQESWVEHEGRNAA
jgi:hypothetical protein